MIRRFLNDERGSNAAEIVIIAPVLALLIALLVAGGRTALADNATQGAAMSAARAASLARTPAEAASAAEDAAVRSMNQSGIACADLTVNLDLGGLSAPLGTTGIVSAAVNCTVNLSDITLPGVPGSRVMTSNASSPVDAYRERS